MAKAKPRCPECGRVLHALYGQRRRGAKRSMSVRPWLECEGCVRVFPAGESRPDDVDRGPPPVPPPRPPPGASADDIGAWQMEMAEHKISEAIYEAPLKPRRRGR